MLYVCVCVFWGGEVQGNEPGVSVDYGTTDPVVRWDSYENFNLHHEDSVEGMCTQSSMDSSVLKWKHTSLDSNRDKQKYQKGPKK